VDTNSRSTALQAQERAHLQAEKLGKDLMERSAQLQESKDELQRLREKERERERERSSERRSNRDMEAQAAVERARAQREMASDGVQMKLKELEDLKKSLSESSAAVGAVMPSTPSAAASSDVQALSGGKVRSRVKISMKRNENGQ
jgi:hypothetical protein